MRKLIAIAFSLILTTAAFAAQTPRPREAPFKLASARVEKFERGIDARGVRYDAALVLRLVVERRVYERLPMSTVPLLYIGTHELRPMASDLGPDTVVLTFHDPKWQELQGGEPMVLTTRHGDPVANPETYAGYPRFDRGMIEEK